MDDPGSAFSAPPPRYLLESDSSDEEGQGWYAGQAGPSRPKIKVGSSPNISLAWPGDGAERYDTVIVAIGQAGKYLLRKFGRGNAAISVLRDGEGIGHGWAVGGDLMITLATHELGHEDIWEVAKILLKEVNAASWLLFDTHLPAMYIPDSPSKSQLNDNAPIRFLQVNTTTPLTVTEGLAPLSSPNYITGFAAAMASLAVHPSAEKAHAITALSLPLPLSYLPTKIVSQAVGSISPRMGQVIANSKGKWDDNDDEPYTGAGMGGNRSSKSQGSISKEDIGSMYM